MTIHWLYLLLAGVFEIGWPIGLKLAAKPGMQLPGFALAILCLTASGALLWLALKAIPIGMAYAIWTGIGAAGTFLVGIYFFGDAQSLLRWAGVALIIAGVIALKISSTSA